MKDSSDAEAEESKEPQGWLEWFGLTSSYSDMVHGEDAANSEGTRGNY